MPLPISSRSRIERVFRRAGTVFAVVVIIAATFSTLTIELLRARRLRRRAAAGSEAVRRTFRAGSTRRGWTTSGASRRTKSGRSRPSSYQLTALARRRVAAASSRSQHPPSRGQRPAGRWRSRGPPRRCRFERAAAAGLVFVLLPVHTESVAWITGRVDSMPAFFYLASFLAYVRWRRGGSTAHRLYALSLLLFFVALFTKQNTITMVGTLAAYDVLVFRRSWQPIARFARTLPPVRGDDGRLSLAALLRSSARSRAKARWRRGLANFVALVERHARPRRHRRHPTAWRAVVVAGCVLAH